MTIPSRPAPPPPQQSQNGGVQKLTIKIPPPIIKNGSLSTTNYGATNSTITRHFPAAKTRYAPTTNWNGSPFESSAHQQTQRNSQLVGFSDATRKVPPPRPPPPKVSITNAALKKSGATPQSINVLSNLFGRKKAKTPVSAVKPLPSFGNSVSNSTKYPQVNPLFPGNSNSQSSSLSQFTANSSKEVELISFDSPPSSPTLTQKSNSDCVSVDSFSSDSNFSSPNNGSVSQPESGFEDDFSASRATTSPSDPWETLEAFSGENIYSGGPETRITAPVRNLNIISNRMQNSNDNPLCNGKSLLPPAPTLSMPTIIKPKISQKPKAPKPPSLIGKQPLPDPYGFIGGSASILDDNTDLSESPPMPNCAPPPPPPGVSRLDVIKGTADALSLYSDLSEPLSPYGVALYDFNGDADGDLNFRQNAKIYLLEKLNDEWLFGRDKRGCEGMFPANYIDIKVPLRDNAVATTAASSTTGAVSSHFNTTTTRNTKIQVRSLYSFVPEHQDDLALNENDLVTVICRINDDWLFGEVSGRQGQFPANFLEYIPDNIPMP